MELSGKVVVVTGAANGIGRAMALRFAAEGARGVVVADLDAEGAAEAAARIDAHRAGSALAVTCDVAVEAEVAALVTRAEDQFGPVDLFCANAGVAIGTDPLSTPDAVWDLAFAVNVRAHIYAARRLLPGWLARGEGYFLATASAAGLLTQIGSAPYAVTKHAAVAFAEWLAVTYGDRGVGVSVLCPMGVNTNLLNAGLAAGHEGAMVVREAGAILEPEQVADVVVQGLSDERFLILPHPDVLTFFQRKGSDYDRWLSGMRRLQARVS
jgi:NAD(P)-dependent dehydrogenase (short-subunit alcohol dehydrogenase family)